MLLSVVNRMAPEDRDTSEGIIPRRNPEKQVPRFGFLFTLTADPKDKAALPAAPIVFRNQIGNRLAGFDSSRDREITGDIKLLITRIRMNAIPLAQQTGFTDFLESRQNPTRCLQFRLESFSLRRKLLAV